MHLPLVFADADARTAAQGKLLLCLPTLMSFVIDLIRLRESSESKIMPSMPLYSSKDT